MRAAVGSSSGALGYEEDSGLRKRGEECMRRITKIDLYEGEGGPHTDCT